MMGVQVGASRGLRGGCLSLAAVVALLAFTNEPADARRHHRRSHARLASLSSSYDPPYAAIVVDAKNGAVLHQANPDAPRHPASLTKIMTLYLLFERMETGKMTLDTQMPVSELASRQAPTKLGLKPGSTLRVEDAIKGLVTKSANDAAMVIAETLGGSEEEFGRMMTRKARSLGMRNTVYVNPNGLPDDAQISTARDQALLGIAIQERFPQYYRYFSLPSFVYRGQSIRNHNHLLGSVEGVDGIKTGYTRDSGFNLVTSVRRGPRHIVAVVLGGRSASRRDARMRELIEENIAQASTKPQPVQVADAAKQAAPQIKPTTLASAERTPAMPPVPRAAETTSAIMPGSNAPLTPVRVKTVSVKLVPPRNAVAAAKPEPVQSTVVAQAALAAPQVTEEAEASPDEALAQTLAAAAPIEPAQSQQQQQQQAAPTPPPPATRPGVLGHLPAMVAAAKEAAIPSAKADEIIPSHRTTTRGGWAIQIGAYEDEGEAKQKLSNAKGKISQMLHKAEAYIERTVKGAKTYYRARFAGLDREQAETACKRLKREDVACMALKI